MTLFRLKFFLPAFLLFHSFVLSQNFKVSGTLIDSENNEPLESATVFMETVADSTLLTYTISGKGGRFVLEGNTGHPKARINISYVGYQDYQKEIDLQNRNQDLGEIKLESSVDQLGEVVITSRAPIVMKRDTLEFNVASFKTKKDATIEDLLKQLPGVEVAMDGSIMVNGKPVSEIMVNGKPFFGGDPTIATRNLTKEMIEKIQVTDTKTESEAFTGETGNQESKTINLTIREDRNRGYFGRVAAGGGTDKRFECAGLVNYFDNDRRLSALLGGNNINSPGFSFGEIQKMFGRGSSMRQSRGGSFSIDGRNFGSGEGIVNSRIWGANYADVITKGFEVSADYFHTGSHMRNDTKTERENILPNRRYFTDSETSTRMESDRDRVNMKFDIKIDSTFLINIRPSFSYAKSISDRKNHSSSFNENREETNEASTDNHNESHNRNFSNRLSLTKKYGSRGGFFRVSMNNQWEEQTGDDFQYSSTKIFGQNPSEEIRNQKADTDDTERSFTGATTFRYPVFKNKWFLDLDYSYSDSRSGNTKLVNDFNEITQDFTDFNQVLSTDYSFSEIRSKPSLALAYRDKGMSLGVSGGYVMGKLEGTDGLRPDLFVENYFEAFEAGAHVFKRIQPTSTLNFNYNLRTNSPSIRQLLPSVDVSNPLNTVIGNPDLKPSRTNSFFAGYYINNYQKGLNVFINMNGEMVDHAVVTKSIIDENNLRTTTYENVNGNKRLNASFHVNNKFKLDSIKSITVGGGVWGSLRRNVNFNNGIQYLSKNNSIGPNIILEFSWLDAFEIESEYYWNLSGSRYDNRAFADRNFSTHDLQVEVRFTGIKNLEWNSSINYRYNPDVQRGFQKTSWLWNSTIQYAVLKDKGIISLKVYDLLNQNVNVRRSASENFIEDRQTSMLRRYVLFGFSYKFNTMKGGE